ncbi:MAG TPA: hemerythrin domain-containing protein [Pyrinomonadaceae bacterium]|nr:hemerythrin domain-containing protein [Pyrinomonadaceae bacterium]
MSDELAHDHAELDKLLGELRSALDGGDAKQVHHALDLFWARLAVHIRAEHLGLFPAVSRVLERKFEVGPEGPSLMDAQSLIAELRRDHDFFMRELSRAIASVRRCMAAPDQGLWAKELVRVKERIAAVTDRLVNHNKLEEQGIYLWAGTLLNQQEQSDLAARVRDELGTMPPRFVQSDLSDHLATDL